MQLCNLISCERLANDADETGAKRKQTLACDLPLRYARERRQGDYCATCALAHKTQQASARCAQVSRVRCGRVVVVVVVGCEDNSHRCVDQRTLSLACVSFHNGDDDRWRPLIYCLPLLRRAYASGPAGALLAAQMSAGRCCISARLAGSESAAVTARYYSDANLTSQPISPTEQPAETVASVAAGREDQSSAIGR